LCGARSAPYEFCRGTQGDSFWGGPLYIKMWRRKAQMIMRSMQLRRRQILAKPRSMVGILLFVSVCAGTGCDKQGQSAPSLPPPPEVLVAAVMQRDVPIYSGWLGTTDGAINAQIRARVQGYLQQRL